MKLISEGDPIHKPKAYTIVGQLGQKIPALINKDFSLLEKFFDTLAAVSKRKKYLTEKILII